MPLRRSDQVADSSGPCSSAPLEATEPTRKLQRVLACSLCQQRKVKCDRRSPCGNCTKLGKSCIPAALAPRRRRFPERALLDRLRKYESLLQEHKIEFEPLHSAQVIEGSLRVQGGDTSDEDGEQPHAPITQASASSATTQRNESHWPKDIWKALYKQAAEDRDDESDSSYDQVRESTVKKAWDVLFNNSDHLILGLRKSVVDLSRLHPEPIHIIRLWQIYLDNVDPLLKVTHNSTLQGRIIDAASRLNDIESPLEALMFSIYCISVLSLSDEDCQTMFNASKKDLLTRNHLACQEALLNCGYMRTNDRDCLTALHLYLVSAGQSVDPRALSSMLGAAIRIGQRMGIHGEAANTTLNPHEAEMRRRLWWSLVLFDARIAEMADFKSTILGPNWDCKMPLNMGDSELRADIKEPPAAQMRPTEAIFPVVRSEIAQFLRHTTFFLDLTCPALKPLAKDRQHASSSTLDELIDLERMIEDKYLKFCDPENPLQYMTIWTARGFIAKYQLVEYYTKYSSASPDQAEAQRSAATFYAFRILDCDTKVMTSHLTKGYTWLAKFYFPLPAYLYLVQYLKKQPLHEQADRAWELMSENHAARFTESAWVSDENPLFKMFSGMVLETWEVREAALRQLGRPLTTPRVVSETRKTLARIAEAKRDLESNQSVREEQAVGPAPVVTPDDVLMRTLLTYDNSDLTQTDPWSGMNTTTPAPGPFNPLWAPMGWGMGGDRGW
ncbi:hypothetical protein HD806DRAFT_495026 [Xylariaceae sp. AK1471]|nr:hypothetical protein HD806DRAFT_495026 [Xylariaceae sp. AK1471]